MTDENDNYLNSLERAIDITEGQIALAQATGGTYIAMDIERAQKLLDAITATERNDNQ